MEQFDTLPIQCRHIEHMHEGVYNFCLHRFYWNLRLLVQTITCQVFSLTLTVRGVSNKHCLLTFFILSIFERLFYTGFIVLKIHLILMISICAPNKGTPILYRFLSPLTVLSLTENSKIKVLFKALEWFYSTFQGKLIFKDFSRKPSIFNYFASMCQPRYRKPSMTIFWEKL